MTLANSCEPPSITCVGLSRASSELETAPGWRKGSLGYHGDDGSVFSGSLKPCCNLETFTAGDTIGCGVNFDQSAAFYTKNGRFLGKSIVMVSLAPI